MTMEELAYWSENASWVHSQMSLLKQSNALAALG